MCTSDFDSEGECSNHSHPTMKKRYQYWSKDGLAWTDWFDIGDTKNQPEFQMSDRRIFCRLKNEYKEN